MSQRLLAALAALLLAAPQASAGPLPGHKSLTTTKYGVTTVTAPVRAGRKAQRFEVRPGDCAGEDCKTDRERAQYTIDKSWRYGTQQWVGFSLYLPQDFTTSDRVDTTFAILHQKGGPTNRSEGRVVDPPVAQLLARGNRFVLTVHFLTGDAQNVRDDTSQLALASVDALRGKWTDILLHFDTSDDRQLLEVYLNGTRRVAAADLLDLGVKAAGLPVYQREAAVQNFISLRPREYNFQYGIYRAFVSRNGGPMPAQIAFFDEVRMGKAIENTLVNTEKPVD